MATASLLQRCHLGSIIFHHDYLVAICRNLSHNAQMITEWFPRFDFTSFHFVSLPGCWDPVRALECQCSIAWSIETVMDLMRPLIFTRHIIYIYNYYET